MSHQAIFREAGSKAVLLLHAFTASPLIFEDLIKALHNEGYTVYAPVLSGHDTNNYEDLLNYTMEDWIQDGREALSFLREKNYEDVVVSGLSLGGMITMFLLLEDPTLQVGGVFATPLLGDLSEVTKIPTHFKRLYETHMNQSFSSEQQEKLDNIMASMQGAIGKMTPRYASYLGDIFIAQGEMDEVIDPTISKRVTKALRGAGYIDYHSYRYGMHYLTSGQMNKQVIDDYIEFLTAY